MYIQGKVCFIELLIKDRAWGSVVFKVLRY